MLSLEDHAPADPDRLLPRCKGIYHAGCTDYPYPNLPMPLQLGQQADWQRRNPTSAGRESQEFLQPR